MSLNAEYSNFIPHKHTIRVGILPGYCPIKCLFSLSIFFICARSCFFLSFCFILVIGIERVLPATPLLKQFSLVSLLSPYFKQTHINTLARTHTLDIVSYWIHFIYVFFLFVCFFLSLFFYVVSFCLFPVIHVLVCVCVWCVRCAGEKKI